MTAEGGLDLMVRGTAVELHVPDFEPIRRYYTKIGFEVVWERAPEGKKGYLVLRMGANVLMFWGGNDEIYNQGYFKQYPSSSPRGYGVEIVIMVEGVRSYFERVKDFVQVVKPLKEQPWGIVDFRIVDPAGFLLRVTEQYDLLDPQFSVK
jgi:predicted enzyme related to lactoylglutathione lyase